MKKTVNAQGLHLAPERCYASYQQMAQSEVARDDGIDVVAIVTPNHLHAPIAVEFCAQVLTLSVINHCVHHTRSFAAC